MRLRMTLAVLDRGAAAPATRELEVEAADGSTAADLIDVLVGQLGCAQSTVPDGRSDAAPDVRVGYHVSAGGDPVAPTAPLGRPPLVDGVALTLAPGPPRAARHRAAPPRTPVRLAVTHGPDAGRLVEVPVGRHTLGRSPEADVRIDDSLLSRLHAEVVVAADGVRVRDLASTNGTRVGRECADDDLPTALLPGSEIVLGETTITLRAATGVPAVTAARPDGTRVVNRRPRVRVAMEPPSFTMPSPPAAPRPNRIPWLAMVLPIPVAAAMAVYFGPTMLAFALMGPLLLGATHLSDRWGGRRTYAGELAEHERRLREVQACVDAASAAEAVVRRAALPDAAAILSTAAGPTARLWERRRHDDDALAVSVGRCSATSRLSVLEPAAEHGARRHPMLAAVPCEVPLASIGVFGICGPRELTVGTARHLVGQLAVLHSPLDLSLVVISAQFRHEWSWLGRLPHTRRPDGASVQHSSAALTLDEPATRAAVSHWAAIVTERVGAARAGGATGRWQGPWTLVLLDGAAALRGLPGLATILEQGPEVGVITVALDERAASLPAEAGAALDLTGPGAPHLSLPRAWHQDLVIDRVGAWWADRLSRALAPLRDATPGDAEEVLPTDVAFTEVAPLSVGAGAIAERWCRQPSATAVPVGVGLEGTWSLDLETDGPHVLVGGTTGSGKSEFLRVVVSSLAVHNRPENLSFVLVDYKGGAAFRECALLPHTAGVVTDLDDHLAQRALTSLTAELKRRERLLQSAGVSDFAAYRSSSCREPLARLVLVVDEFRALAEDLPEFVDGMVRIAALGRSLGVHLVLATQRPAGVVTADIKANMNLRVALRVRDRADSEDVVEAPDAAALDPTTPGRGFCRAGGGAVVGFQAAHTGGSAKTCAANGIRVRDLSEGSRPGPWVPATAADEATGTLVQVVTAVREAAAALGATAARSAWLPALPNTLGVDQLPIRSGALDCPVGLRDHPERQEQAVLSVDLGQPGHWAFVGTSGSGRSTALATLAASAAHRLDAAQVHLYAISGGPLNGVAALPHCGAHVDVDDLPRLERLVGRLSEEVARRRQRPDEEAPHILLLVDDWDLLAGRHESLEHSGLADRLVALLREGAGHGLTAAIAGDRSLLVGRAAAVVSHRVVLRLADSADAALVGLRAAALPTTVTPGRGVLVDGTEVQLATARNLRPRPSQAPAGRRPLRVEALPPLVHAHDLAPSTGDLVVVGVGGDNAAPLGLSEPTDGRRWLVAGPSASGVSSALALIAQQLLNRGRAVAVVSDRPGPLDYLRGDRRWAAWCGATDAGALAEAKEANPDLAVVVDCADELQEASVDTVLRDLARLVDRDAGLVVVGANSTALATQYRGVAVDVARHRVGLLLGAATITDGDLFGLRLRPDRHAPVGRGHLVRRGGATPLQVAWLGGEQDRPTIGSGSGGSTRAA